MKKILSLIVAFALAGSMNVSAFAATTNTQNKLDQRIEKLQERQQRINDSIAKAQEKQSKLAAKETTDEFKQALIAKRQLLLKNQEEKLTKVLTNNQLRLSYVQSLNTIKQSGSVLSEETTSQIKDIQSQIKQINDSHKQTKDQIKTIKEQNKANIQNKDTTAVEAAYDQILLLQTSRTEQLMQITNLLQQMNDLLKNT